MMDYEHRSEKHRSPLWVKFVLAFAVLLSLLLAVSYCGMYSIHRKIASEMSPEEQKEMSRFLDSKIVLPKKWQEVKPFSKELQDASSNILKKWENTKREDVKSLGNYLDRLQGGEILDESVWLSLDATLNQHADLMNDFSAISALPGYELNVFMRFKQDTPFFSLFREVTALFCLDAYSKGHQGKMAEGLERAFQVFKMCGRPLASHIISHTCSYRAQADASLCVASLCRSCTDTALLESLLKDMERMDRVLNCHISGEVVVLLDCVADLRLASRENIPVDLSSERTGTDLVFDRMSLYGNTYKGGPKFKELPGFSRLDAELKYSLMPSHPSFIQRGANESKAMYNLARIAIVSRIQELRTGKAPRSAEELDFSLLPEGIHDPFSAKPFLWDATRGIPYSVGPDEMDDAQWILFDKKHSKRKRDDISVVR